MSCTEQLDELLDIKWLNFFCTQLGLLWMLLQLGHLSLQETSKLKAVHRTCSWARLSLMVEQQYHEFNGIALMEYCRACSSHKIRTLSFQTVWTAALGSLKN